MNDKRKRTLASFAFLFVSILVLALTWSRINGNVDEEDGPPVLLRRVLDLNGQIWQNLFRPTARSVCAPPPKGKKARVNGRVGIKPVEESSYSLEILEDDQNSAARRFHITMKELRALPRTDLTTQLRCIEGWAEDMAFAGVRFSDFVKAYHLKTKPYVGLRSVDGEYYVSIDLASMMHDQTLLAYEISGEPLPLEHGAPLRLAISVKYGIKNIKQVGQIFFSDQRPPDYWAERGYDWFAGL